MSESVGTLTDADLVRAAQAGDTAGLGALLERHRSRLHAIAVSILGHGPQAEDAVQDACVIALRRIGELRDPAAARAWLTTILVNVCRGQLRRPTRGDRGRPMGPTRPRHRRAGDRRRRAPRLGLDRARAVVRAAAPRGHAALLHGRELLRGDRTAVRRPRRHRPQPPEHGEGKLAEELLETAAVAHDEAMARWRASAPLGEAYLRLERDGDVSAFDGVLTRDVAYVMYDRIERRGATRYAEELAGDFEDGVRSPRRPGHPRQRGHDRRGLARQPARPAAALPTRPTQIHFHHDGPTSRIVSHYAPRPVA